MNFHDLKQIFLEETNIERTKRDEGNLNHTKDLTFDALEVLRISENHFFKEGNIFISKHHRYFDMPSHTHDFVEFNYMLSGSCVQYIDGQKVVLQKGEILLMDKDIVQKIVPLGEQDILINILLKGDSITTEIVVNMAKSHGLVNEFILNASKEYGIHNAFIHFACGDKEEIQLTIHQLILEYYTKENYYMRSMNLLLSILLIQLTRIIEEETLEEYQHQNGQTVEVLELLRYIDLHYKQLTLTQLAEKFDYNSNYMSNKLKKETGHSFQELINSLRYKTALELMEETTFSLEEIAYEIGYETVPSLYKLFSKFTKQKPKEIKDTLSKSKER